MNTDEKLDALAALAEDPGAHRDEIGRFLADRNNYVVSRAVRLAADAGFEDLDERLVVVFEAFMRDPVKRDPGCHAKLAVVDVLKERLYYEEEPFLTAVRHRQMEPAFGPPVDTAVPLRVAAAMALAHLRYGELAFELAALLNDPEPVARSGVCQVLEYVGSEASEVLLRMKLLAGDPEPDVLAECLGTIMRIAPERHLTFVAEHLGRDDAFLSETAALAVGESRLPEAFDILRHHYGATFSQDEKAALLLPIALTRQPPAVELLLEQITDGPRVMARAALEAMRIFAGDERVGEQVDAAVEARDDPDLLALHRARNRED